MINKIFLLITLVFFSFNLSATNIRVVDLQYLIDQNKYLNQLIKNIDKDQKIHIKKFNETELKLQSDLEKIEVLVQFH